MDKKSTGKCTVAICHTEEMKETLFDILDRMKCSICDVSSLDDILNLVKDSGFDYLQFSDRNSNQFGSLSDIVENNSVSNTTKNNGDGGDSNSKYQKFTLFEVEKFIIFNALNKCDWNKKAAAKLLGIDRATIYRKIKKLGIIRPD